MQSSSGAIRAPAAGHAQWTSLTRIECVIRLAGQALGSWRKVDCDLDVLEAREVRVSGSGTFRKVHCSVRQV